MKKLIIGFILSLTSCLVMDLFATNQVQRLEELENISLFLPSDDLSVEEEIPTPLIVKQKYNLTNDQLLTDILTLTRKYSLSETNEEKKMVRDIAIGWIGMYGTTNNLPYLANIMTNSSDYAQQSAIGASMALLKHSSLFVPLIKNVVTNNIIYSYGDRQRVYIIAYRMCKKNESDDYIDDSTLHARIASFFLEQAAVERDFTLFVDRVACELNPTYKHSQQRRDNLARLRKPGLTGLPAQIYDAAQRDAQPKEEE